MADTDQIPDLNIVALTLCGEAESGGYVLMQGVGSTIQKRTVLHWQHETTSRGVCLHFEQYSCWLPGRDRNRIMAPDFVIPDTALVIAGMILNQTLPDNTDGSTSYFDDSISPPTWATQDKFRVKIDTLNFYDLSG